MNLENAVSEPTFNTPNPPYPDARFIMEDGKVVGIVSRKTGKAIVKKGT